MSPKRISSILSMLEIAENNLRIAREHITRLAKDSGIKESKLRSKPVVNNEETEALEVVEGYFDGESMIGDNGKTYPVPPNYASKTQLVIGDRMKWILTSTRESFKLIKPAERERVVGTFGIDGDMFYVWVDELDKPVRVLKASATFAMKNLGMRVGDRVAIIIPKNSTPSWGALSSVVSSDEENEQEQENFEKEQQFVTSEIEESSEQPAVDTREIDELEEFSMKEAEEAENDYF